MDRWICPVCKQTFITMRIMEEHVFDKHDDVEDLDAYL